MISASSLVYSCVAHIVTACSGSPHNHFLVYTVKLLSLQMCAHLGLHQLTFVHPLVSIPLHAVKGWSQASIMAHSSCCIQCSSYWVPTCGVWRQYAQRGELWWQDGHCRPQNFSLWYVSKLSVCSCVLYGDDQLKWPSGTRLWDSLHLVICMQ